MRAGSLVGRVGALAVALGVGAAAATAVAWADPDGSDSTSSASTSAGSSSASSSATTSASENTATTSRKPAQKNPKKTSKPGGVDRPSKRQTDRADKAESASESAKPDVDASSDTKPAAPPAAKAGVEAAESQTSTGTAADASTVEAPAGQTPVETPAEPGPTETPAETATVEPPAPEPTPSVEEQATSTSAKKMRSPQAQQTSTAKPEASLRATDAAADETVEKTVVAKVSVDPVVQTGTDPVVSTTPAVLSFATPQAVTSVQETAKAKPSVGAAVKAVATGVQKLVTSVLGALGFNPTAASSPTAPTGIGALVVGLLGWGSRRESEQAVALASASTPITTALTVAPLAAVATQPTSWVGWVTGANSLNNTVARFGIAGTDVGIMWDNGVTGDDPNTTIVEQHQVLIAFGDTFSGDNMTGTWRNNVLFRTADNVLSNGLYVPDGIINDPGAYSGSPMTYQNFAREIIGKYPYSKATQVTIIPTGAISVEGAAANGGTRQYIAFMSIKSWDSPGKWTTNYAGISYSDDNGQNWTVVPASSIRSPAYGRSTVSYQSGQQNFQMVSFVKPPEGSADAAAGYVYAYGTPSGRNGTVYLSRVNESQILDVSKYQYWDGKKWVTNKPSAAAPVLPATTTSSFLGLFKKTTYPSAGELSVQYNSYLNKYVMLSTDGNNNVVMRTADSPQGTWSPGTTLVTSVQYPGLYAPMIHPWSGTDLLKKTDGSPEDPQYLYWNMSLWGNYNVALMKTDLSLV